MSVSIKEIAKICGVSEGTVDRALNNRSGIKSATKEKILKVAKELDYRPNHLARCLATGKTNTIGVVCINMQDTFFSTLLESIEEAAKEKGYFITLILTHNNTEEELDGIKYLINRGVDGLILFPVAEGEEYVRVLKELKVPIVTIYNRISEEFPHIDVNSYDSMRKAVSFIHNKGYESIAYLDINFEWAKKRNVNIYSFERRRGGYVDGIAELGLECVIIDGLKKERVMEYITEKDNSNEKRAILCSYDNLAIRVLSICRYHGVSVPGDVGIMGFNNLKILDDIYPRIYSIDCNIDHIGKAAFDRLFGMMNGDIGSESGDIVTEYRFAAGETL